MAEDLTIWMDSHKNPDLPENPDNLRHKGNPPDENNNNTRNMPARNAAEDEQTSMVTLFQPLSEPEPYDEDDDTRYH